MSVSRAMVRRAFKRRKTPVSGLEHQVRGWLDNAGVAYRTQYQIGMCHVDLLLGDDLVVEINGCFWHGHMCQKVLLPRQRRWQAKDRKRYASLMSRGYKLMLLWECGVHEHGEAATVAALRERLESGV
jgi:DNA mismatch endonuclease (patch repair protein)